MANLLSGLIAGGVVAGVSLGAASLLIPARPVVTVPATLATPEKPADIAPAADPTAPDAPAPETSATAGAENQTNVAPTAAETPEKTPSAQIDAPSDSMGANIASDNVTSAKTLSAKPPGADALTSGTITPDAPTAKPAVAAPAAPTVAQEALLDPKPAQLDPAATDAVASGSKMVAAPKAAEQPADSSSAAPAVDAVPDAKTVDAKAVDDAAVEETAVDDTAGARLAQDAFAAPLEKYAAAFDNPGTKPLFAVILQDTGGADLDRAALAALPFPVTFALDPETPNATDAMAIYRAAGKEVVMLTAGLPDGATAQDLETSFQTYDTLLPETVAVMGPAKGGFQDNGVLAKLIVPVIAGQGRGMITFDRGLNSAAQVAAREGLAAGKVFRQIDGNGESVSVIRRYLDRAVFKAAQDGSAMVVGETLPDTITALTEWSIEGRASDVTLAPVSALLK